MPADDDWINRKCATEGCDRRVALRSRGLCKSCQQNRFKERSVWDLTAEERAQIVRRMRRFESPAALAKEFRLSHLSINHIMRWEKRK